MSLSKSQRREEKVGKGRRGVVVKLEGWMGWDLLVVSCAGDRGRSDGREAISSGKKKSSKTSKTR